jgi:hypothetical protein
MEDSPKYSDRTKREALDGRTVGAAEWHKLKAHRHTDFQARKIVDLDATLDNHLIGEFDIADGKWPERGFVICPDIRRRLWAKPLDGEGPKMSGPIQPDRLVQFRFGSARQRKHHPSVTLAPPANKVRAIGGRFEKIFCQHGG